MELKLTISNQTITITEALDLVADTENVYEAEYEFGDEWDGYSRTAVFEGCGSTYQVVLTNTNKCSIPNEILADSGYVRFGVLGTKVSGSITLRYPTVWSEKVWVDVASIGTGTPSEPTAEVYAQILANEDAIEDRLDEAEDAIDTLEEEAHTHSNKSILDTITSTLTTAWSAAVTWISNNGAALLAHIDSSTIHTNSTEKATWNGKQNQLTAGTNITIENDVISSTASGGTTDFEELDNRPKYNGSVMTGSTNIPTVPTKTSELTNDSGFITDTKAFVATYGTTTASEIAAAITAGKAIFCRYTNGGVTNQLMLVDETSSKYGFAESTVGTNDGITSVAGITIALNKQDNTWDVYTGSGSIPTKTSDLTNDSGFLTAHQSLSAYRTSAAQDVIDATKANSSDVYTKSQTDNLLDDKVNITENSLTTTSKNVVLAINEVNALAASKSAVSVSNAGTATDTVGYITIDGVEKKLAGGGTGDYTELTNKPQINSVTLTGNKTSSDLGLVSAETGKGLSTNDYDATEKANVASNTSARHSHSNKALLDTYTQTEADLASAVSNNHTHSNKSVLDGITSALVSAWNTASTWITTNGANVLSHITNTSNPHSVTASQVGLGNCNNTSDANKPISTATQTALDAKADIVKQTSISLSITSPAWELVTGETDVYEHSITTISGVTSNTKVDLQPSASIVKQLIDDDVSALYVLNNSGTLKAIAVGSAPTAALNDIQVTYYEVN